MSDDYQNLVSKLMDKIERIGVLGLGCVGLPLSMRFSEAGYKVIGLMWMPVRLKN